MGSRVVLENLDPVDDEAVGRATADPVFDELLDQLFADDEDRAPGADLAAVPSLRPAPRHRRGLVAAAAVLVLAGTLAGVSLLGSSHSLHGPLTTPWRAAHPFSSGAGAHPETGTWQLLDAQLGGTWQLDVHGPPPGYLTCPTARACYVMSEHYTSSMAGAAPLGETLYVSADAGTTWSALTMPTGFTSTGPLACATATWCAAGGTYEGQPVLLTTANGGHSFTLHPLPGGVGTLRALSCPSAVSCDGLAATATAAPGTQDAAPVDASFLVIGDGGRTFRDEPIISGQSMTALTCTSSLDCVTVGRTDGAGDLPGATAVGAVTIDGGRSWQPSTVPTGFGVDATFSRLSCTGAGHCMVLGTVPVKTDNPPQCSSRSPQSSRAPAPPASTTPPEMSPTVKAISNIESALRTKANRQEVSSGQGFSCEFPDTWTTVSDIATSTDGGRTWTPRLLPSDVPSPSLAGLACSSATDCWVAGQEEVPRGGDMGTPVLLGTSDGGTSWSKVTFSVPATAPNPTGQSYLSIGAVSCPSPSVCVARGVAVANAKTAPVYQLVIPEGTAAPGSGGPTGS